jgi:Isocitrate/isopropylmalate dehydrogenase
VQTLKIAVIPGDEIGKEVIPEGIRSVEVAGRLFSAQFEWISPKKDPDLHDESNGISHTMPYWDSRAAAMAQKYVDVRVSQYHIDILTANFVRRPEEFDMVVASNLFGDILSDLGPACTGTSPSPRLPTSTPSDDSRQCSSRFTVQRQISPARESLKPVGNHMGRGDDDAAPGVGQRSTTACCGPSRLSCARA